MTTYNIGPFSNNFFFHVHNHTIKIKVVGIIHKNWTHVFKTGDLIIGLHFNGCIKDCDHTRTLVCTNLIYKFTTSVRPSDGARVSSNLDFKNLCPATQRGWSVCLFFGEILPNFDLKNMISTYTKDFARKNGPNSPDFQ